MSSSKHGSLPVRISLYSVAGVFELGSIHIIKVRVLQSSQCWDASVWVKSYKSWKEIYFQFIERRCMLRHGHTLKFRESLFKIIKFQRIWPVVLIGCSKDFKDFEYLVDLTISHEEGSSLNHLSKYASGWPEINTQCISFLSQQDLWTSVPKSYNFVCIGLDWQAKCSGETKICKLNQSSFCIN